MDFAQSGEEKDFFEHIFIVGLFEDLESAQEMLDVMTPKRGYATYKIMPVFTIFEITKEA